MPTCPWLKGEYIHLLVHGTPGQTHVLTLEKIGPILIRRQKAESRRVCDGDLQVASHNVVANMAPQRRNDSMDIDSDSDISIDLDQTTKGKGKAKGKGAADKRRVDKGKAKAKDTVSFSFNYPF